MSSAALLILAVVAQQGRAADDRPPPSARPDSAAAVTAVRAATPPKIDGRDDDAVWETVQRVTAFHQFQPKVDVDPSFRTKFRVAYDEKNLYVFVWMFDPHPDSIMHAFTRHDQRGHLLAESVNYGKRRWHHHSHDHHHPYHQTIIICRSSR
jgi:hypothetical protein